MEDDGFKVKSERATKALKAAADLLTWCMAEESKKELDSFSDWLVSSLRKCLSADQRSFVLRAEKIWAMFHQLRTSRDFRSKWDSFFETSIKKKAIATVYQYITTRIFRELIKNKFEIKKDVTHTHYTLTLDEKNALRYVAGYVCLKVQKKIEKTSHKYKDEIVLLLIEFYGDSMDGSGTEEWTNQIDRGGLWHISDDTYLVFEIVEYEIRNYLHVKALTEIDDSTKKTILDAIMSNEDLLTLWGMSTGHYGEEVSQEVLRRLSEMYLTVRGFSFASSCLELYKQQNRTQLQKSKGLRRKLQNSHSEDK